MAGYRFSIRHWLPAVLVSAGLCGAGCSGITIIGDADQIPVPSASRVRLPDAPPPATIARVQAVEPLPPPKSAEKTKARVEPLPPPKSAEPTKARVLPITLDAVLRLAEDQNPQIAQARAKVNEALAERDLAGKRWLPDWYVGMAYYRHEGGIQDQNGDTFTSSTGALFPGMEMNAKMDLREYVYHKLDAERKAWQQKGELTKISTENLLEAAYAYIDLLTARTGEAIAIDQKKTLSELLARAEKIAAKEPGAKVEETRVRSEFDGQQQAIAKLRQQGNAASAKLVYLLGLDPAIELLPADPRLVPFDLIDAQADVNVLVNQALTNGPGVRELEGLLALISEGMEKAQSPMRFMPVMEVRMAEGMFGGGPGAQMGWSNRWDLGMQLRWNLTEYVTVRERRRIADARMLQAQFAYQDLRGKLTAGILEARDAIHSGKEQIDFSDKQVKHSTQSYQLSFNRLDKNPASRDNPLGGTYTETLLSLRSISLAQITYLAAIREYDRAQLRLLMLVGSLKPGHD